MTDAHAIVMGPLLPSSQIVVCLTRFDLIVYYKDPPGSISTIVSPTTKEQFFRPAFTKNNLSLFPPGKK
jgi:hypothetical protein